MIQMLVHKCLKTAFINTFKETWHLHAKKNIGKHMAGQYCYRGKSYSVQLYYWVVYMYLGDKSDISHGAYSGVVF